MKKLVLIGFVLLFASCNSLKRNQRVLSKGNYETAIELAVKKLQRDKTSGKNDTRVALLEEAFAKQVDENNRRISFLKKQGGIQAAKEVYYTYQNMANTQDLIRPLLPLYSENLGRNGKFKLVDYNALINEAQKNLVAALDKEAQFYENKQTVLDYRTAYHIYCELEELAPYYPGLQQKKDNTRFYGTDYVLVSLDNRSGQIIPYRLERELLDFNTYGLDDFWTRYDAQQAQDIMYNYGINLTLREIAIAPEQIKETEYRRSKRIKDGWEYVLDRNGNVKKDSLGNDIKRDKYITVTASVLYTDQFKSAFVGGDVLYNDFATNRLIDKHPLTSEFVFENSFARFRGDDRALTPEDISAINNSFIPFPSNEQIIFDTGNELKARFKEILKNNSFR